MGPASWALRALSLPELIGELAHLQDRLRQDGGLDLALDTAADRERRTDLRQRERAVLDELQLRRDARTAARRMQ